MSTEYRQGLPSVEAVRVHCGWWQARHDDRLLMVWLEIGSNGILIGHGNGPDLDLADADVEGTWEYRPCSTDGDPLPWPAVPPIPVQGARLDTPRPPPHLIDLAARCDALAAAEVLRLDGAATPDDWRLLLDESTGYWHVYIQRGPIRLRIALCDGLEPMNREADARLIATYRTAAPALARALKASEAEATALRAERDRFAAEIKAAVLSGQTNFRLSEAMASRAGTERDEWRTRAERAEARLAGMRGAFETLATSYEADRYGYHSASFADAVRTLLRKEADRG